MTHLTPILLLKTRSTPNDAYSDLFSLPSYNPTFVPVLEHRYSISNLSQVRDLLRDGASKKYGGFIFTSQRAVEGFAKVVQEEPVGSMVRCLVRCKGIFLLMLGMFSERFE
jgi:uroporphyrinogen-III synthase